MCCNPEDSCEEFEPFLVISATVVDLHDVSINRCSGQLARYERIRNGVGLRPRPALLRAEYPYTRRKGRFQSALVRFYRRQGLAASVRTIVNGTDVMRFSDQAESSVSDPGASRRSDVVLRAALPAAELRADVDTGVLTARTFIRAASPHR